TVSAASPCEKTTAFLSNFKTAVPPPTLARKSFGSNRFFTAFGMRPFGARCWREFSRCTTQHVWEFGYLRLKPRRSLDGRSQHLLGRAIAASSRTKTHLAAN